MRTSGFYCAAALSTSAVTSFHMPAFTPHRSTSSSVVVLQGEGTGGWGIGGSREMVPEEFTKGDRRAFEGYKLQDRGEFMRQVKRDGEQLKNDELSELLGVAKMAGLKVKDPSERLNKFEDEIMADEDDDLDLSWGGDDAEDLDPFERSRRRSANSVTRLDEDTGASGVW